MNDYALTCCSTADLPASFFEERNIPYVCFTYTIDGVEYKDDLGKSMKFDDFFKRIKEGAMPVTSQVNPDKYIECFEPIFKENKDILHIAFSSGLSGSYASALIARDILSEKYPERKLVVVDSLAASSGLGLLISLAHDLKTQGMSIDELSQWLEDNKLKMQHWVLSTDLTSYFRGGRISRASAIFGTALHICPIINVNNEGKLIPREKYRGKNRVIEEVVNRMEQYANDGLDYSGQCFVSHSACYQDAKNVADLVDSKFKKLKGKTEIFNIGAVIGAHTGPGTVALFFMGEKR